MYWKWGMPAPVQLCQRIHCGHCGGRPFCLTLGAVRSRQVEDVVEDVDSDTFFVRFCVEDVDFQKEIYKNKYFFLKINVLQQNNTKN